MTVIASVPLRSYGNGATPASPKVVNIPTTTIATGVTSARITATRNSWPNIGQDVIAVELRFSDDGGTTWPRAVKATAAGGTLTYKGVTDPPLVIGVPQQMLGDPSNSLRRVSGSITFFTPLTTSATVEEF